MPINSNNLQFLNVCRNCGKLYDDREDVLGLELEICLKCNINNLKITECKDKDRCGNKACKFCFEHSFATHEKAFYWHRTKNDNVKPRDICPGTYKTYFFTCYTCNHDICISPSRILKGRWCSYCINQKRCNEDDCKFCFDHSFASHEKAKYWHYTKNKDTIPRNMAANSHTKCWFLCDICNHDIYMALNKIQSGNWCAYCKNKKRCDEINCKFCFDNSFASHEKSKYWHPTKNGNITPRNVAKCDNNRYWLVCNTCNHDIYIEVSNIRFGNWCPYCANKKRCETIECKFCFNNSFASHERAKYWHPTKNGNIVPRDVAKTHNNNYWFTCEKCNHDIRMSLGNIQRGSWCEYCSHQKRCEMMGCKFCFDNSFASHEKARYWHPTKNGDIRPQHLAKYDNHKYWFICDACKRDIHISLGGIQKGNWCSYCMQKTEAKIFDFLSLTFNAIETQFRLESCKNSATGRYFPFDFCVRSIKVIIEVDGRQHFEDVSHWDSSADDNRKRDIYKMNEANKNGYSVIRIVQNDVWYDTYNWKQDILSSIEKCQKSLQNVFCSSDANQTLYDKYRAEISEKC